MGEEIEQPSAYGCSGNPGGAGVLSRRNRAASLIPAGFLAAALLLAGLLTGCEDLALLEEIEERYHTAGLPWTEQVKIDDDTADQFGDSVAVSAAGEVFAVGAPFTFGMADKEGSVNIFSGWLSGFGPSSSTSGDYGAMLGSSTAVSADGSYVASGAPYYGTDDQGAVHVFTYNGEITTDSTIITDSDGSNGDQFGLSTAISADGTLLAAGAPGYDSEQGTVFVYSRSGNGWDEDEQIINLGEDKFGYSIDLAEEGTILAIGAPESSAYGDVYVYSYSAPSWTQKDDLIISDDQVSCRFGHSIAASSDASVIAVGSPRFDGRDTDSGAAHVFTRSGSSWSEEAVLTASDGALDDWFGWSLAVSGDGMTIAVGSIFHDGNGEDAGAVYVYTSSDGHTWTEEYKITASDGETGDNFGASIDITDDGERLLIGAPHHDSGNSGSGAVYVFDRN